jgi:hypothetical protein
MFSASTNKNAKMYRQFLLWRVVRLDPVGYKGG